MSQKSILFATNLLSFVVTAGVTILLFFFAGENNHLARRPAATNNQAIFTPGNAQTSPLMTRQLMECVQCSCRKKSFVIVSFLGTPGDVEPPAYASLENLFQEVYNSLDSRRTVTLALIDGRIHHVYNPLDSESTRFNLSDYEWLSAETAEGIPDLPYRDGSSLPTGGIYTFLFEVEWICNSCDANDGLFTTHRTPSCEGASKRDCV